MEQTLKKYRQAIQSGKINPVVRWDGQTSKTIFDPTDSNVPLDYTGFGAWRLEQGPFEVKTADREYVLTPICGEFEVSVGKDCFAGSRPGGPFTTQPELSNSSAIYIGRGQQFKISGVGEMIWFSAPAYADRPSAFVKPGDRKQIRRGTGVWHREVITLITTDDFASNLVVGETYSPPGLWSGTPLHVHDKDDPAGGQSDHEEIYYHISRGTEGPWGAYGVQLLFDEKGLDKAYLVHNRDAMAIPGGAHPVVTGPASDMIYIWALVSNKSSPLKMYDIPEFTYLKSVEKIIDELEGRRGQNPVSRQRLASLADQHKIEGPKREILRQHLIERGFEIQ
ncbi:MAG: 5-deoxy-glucuronate isomerase [Phycisphaerae bacterium]